MSRLLDRLFYEGIDFKYAENLPFALRCRDTLARAVPILIDNVARYYFQNRGLRDWSFDDFPNIAPPFETYWMEFRGIKPEDAHPDSRGTTPTRMQVVPRAVGLLVEASDAAPDLLSPMRIEETGESVAYPPDEVRWVTRNTIFYEYERGASPKLTRPLAIGSYTLYITPEGEQHPLSKRNLQVEYFWRTDPEREDGEDEIAYQGRRAEAWDEMKRTLGSFARLVLLPSLLATTFLHCRNTGLVPDDSVSEKVRRAYRRRKKRPMVEFKVLDITGTTKQLRTAGAEDTREGSGLKRALHIRRGHFKHYGAKYGKGKLFGRYEGMFWTPEREVGSSAEGVIEKTYNVEA